jgi:hypothetical protein
MKAFLELGGPLDDEVITPDSISAFLDNFGKGRLYDR